MRQCKRRLNDSKKSLTRGYRSHRNAQSLFLINVCTHIHKPWIVVIQYYTLYDTKQLMCAKRWRAWPLYSSTSPHATRLQELRRSAVTTRSNTPCIIHVHSYWWSSSATVLVETAVATIDSESPFFCTQTDKTYWLKAIFHYNFCVYTYCNVHVAY